MKRNQKRINPGLVLRLLYPPRCPVCDRLLLPENFDRVHESCAAFLYPISDPYCMHCGKSLSKEEKEYCFDCDKKLSGGKALPVKQARALFVYRGAIKVSMYHFKYSNRSSYKEFYAREAVDRLGSWLDKISPDVIIPVPMNARKKRQRGYNQAEAFARELANLLQLPLDTKAVKRTKNTNALKLMTPEERKNNLKNAFHVSQSIVEYRKILLVDDIYTTGNTVETIAQQMCAYGELEVYVLVICIGNGL